MATAPAIDIGPIEKSITSLRSVMTTTVKGVSNSVKGIQSSIQTIRELPKTVGKSIDGLKEGYAKTAAATRTSFAKSLRESAKSSLGGQRGIAEAVRTMRADLIATGMSQQEAQSQALASINANIASQVESMKSSPVAIAKAMGTVSMDGMKFLAGKISGFFGKDKEEQNQEERRQGRMMTLFKKMDAGIGAMGKSLAQKGKAVAGSLFGMLKKGALMLAIPALIAFMKSPMFDKLKVWVVDTLIPALKNLVDIIVPIAQKLGAWVSDSLLPEFFDMLKKHWDSLTTMVSGIVDKVKVLFGPDATWNERIGALLGIFDDIGTFVYDAVRNLGVMILNLFGVDGGALAKKYWDPIAKFFGDIVDSVIEIFTDPVAGIKKLLGTIWNAASGVGKFLYDNLLAPFFTWIGEKLAFIPAGIAGMWTSVTDTVKEVWDSVVAWFEGLWTWASEGIAGTWTGIVDFVKTQFDGVITFLTDLFTWPKTPLGFATKLIDIILLPYNLIINFLADIFGWGDDDEGKMPFSLGTFIVEKILAVVTWVKEKFAFAAGAVIEGWTNLKTFIADGVLAVKNWIVEKFTFVAGAVIDGWTGLKEFVAEKALAVKDWIVGKFTFLVGAVITGWVGLKEFIAEKALAVKDWIVGKFTFVVGAVIDGWVGLKEFVAEKALAVKDWIVGKFTFAGTALIEGWTGLLGFVTGLGKTIKDWFVDKFTFAKDAAIAGWDGLLGFVTGAVGNIKTWFTDKFSFAKDTVIAGWDGLLGFVTGAVGNIKNFFWHEDGKSGILQFENPLADWSPMDWVTNVLTKIKNFFWHPDGKSGVLQFDLLGSLPSFDLGGMFDKIGDMFSIDGILGGIGRKIQAVDPWPGPDLVQDALLKVFDPTKGVTAAMGGMVKADQWAMVGEKGPELVRFKQAGVVANNKQMMAGQDFAMNAMRQSMISQPPAGAGGGGSSTVMITNAPSTSNVANTKVETAAGVSDPHTQLAGVY